MGVSFRASVSRQNARMPARMSASGGNRYFGSPKVVSMIRWSAWRGSQASALSPVRSLKSPVYSNEESPFSSRIMALPRIWPAGRRVIWVSDVGSPKSRAGWGRPNSRTCSARLPETRARISRRVGSVRSTRACAAVWSEWAWDTKTASEGPIGRCASSHRPSSGRWMAPCVYLKSSAPISGKRYRGRDGVSLGSLHLNPIFMRFIHQNHRNHFPFL